MGISDYISRLKSKVRADAGVPKDRREAILRLDKERKELEKKKKLREGYGYQKGRVAELRSEARKEKFSPLSTGLAGLKNVAGNIKKNTSAVEKRKEMGPWGSFGSSSPSNPFTGGGSSYNPWTGKSSSEKKKSRGENITITIRR